MHFFETFVIFPTVEGWNYFLQELGYWVVVAGVYGGIILSGLYRVHRYKKCGALSVNAETCYKGKN